MGLPATMPEVSDQALLERLKLEWEETPFWKWMGFHITYAVPGTCRVSFTARPEMFNHDDYTLHGGIIATLIDTVVGMTICSVYETGKDMTGHTTTDINVSYLEGVLTPEVTVEGRILRKGRTLVVSEGDVRDANGKLCAVGRATYMVFR
jgi:uncharacterized protein (TIGR00369 family)